MTADSSQASHLLPVSKPDVYSDPIHAHPRQLQVHVLEGFRECSPRTCDRHYATLKAQLDCEEGESRERENEGRREGRGEREEHIITVVPSSNAASNTKTTVLYVLKWAVDPGR